MQTMSAEEALDVIDSGVITKQLISKHRWYTKYLIVFQPEDDYELGFYYLEPATEIQEGQDVFESDPVKVFKVGFKQVVQNVWFEIDD